MFKFLREKLKGAIKKFSKDVEEEAVVEVPAQQAPVKDLKAEQELVKETKTPAQKKVKKEEKPVKAAKEEEAPSPQKPIRVTVVDEEPEKVQDVPLVETISVKEIAKEEPQEAVELAVEVPKKKGLFDKMFGKKEQAVQRPVEEPVAEQEPPEAIEEEPRKKESFFTKLTKVSLSKEKFEELFWELEVVLLENNVAVEVIERIKQDLSEALTKEKVSRRSVEELIAETLRKSIIGILSVKQVDLLAKAAEKKPLVIAMIGVNGSGKTTTLAKLVKYFQGHGKSVVVAAADTFRAAAIQQLEEHTTKLGVKLIKQDYNADPAAVAFDAVKHATAKGIDVVLIDSAGRLHSNDNLMNELKKLVRVNKPDINIFVGEAITGNDCVEQAKLFDEAVGIDAIILAKADVDEKGGAAISASFVTGKPVIFLGVGQGYDDLKAFDPKVVVESLGL